MPTDYGPVQEKNGNIQPIATHQFGIAVDVGDGDGG
jgi:hypothetical protein